MDDILWIEELSENRIKDFKNRLRGTLEYYWKEVEKTYS